MRVSLIKRKRIQGLILPNTIFGNYWISDIDENGNERNLISIEAHDGKWIIVSNNNTFCVQNGQKVQSIELVNYHFINLKNVEYINGKKKENDLFLYVCPTIDNYISYDIGNNENFEIKVGKSQNCQIIYKDDVVLDEAIKISRINGKYYITTSALCYVNNKEIPQQQELFIGDVIFYMGLKILLSKKDDKFILMINNPLNKVSVNLRPIENKVNEVSKVDVYDDEDIYMPLYNENDYYHKNPRFEQKIDEYEINIDLPPEPDNTKETPLLITLVPMIMMSLTSLFSGYLNIVALSSKNASLSTSLPSILLCISMIISTIIWPIVTRKYNDKEKKKYEELRRNKYSKYIEEKINAINKEMNSQKVRLIDMYPTTEVCQNTIINKMTKLWERRINDDDFLTVNLGTGSKPMSLKINWPQERFSMAEDSLKEMVQVFIDKPKVIDGVPIELSIKKRNKVAIIGNKDIINNYTKQLLIQLMAYQSYDDLRIVILTDKDNSIYWDFMKYVPYVWSDDRQIRYYAESTEEYKEIFYNLDSILNNRLESKENVIHSPHFLIITDKIKIVRNYDFIKKVIDNENAGFSILALNDKITSIPDQFKTFVEVYGNKGKLILTTANSKPVDFEYEGSKKYDYAKISDILANLPLDISVLKENTLPNTIGFLEMYDVGRVEQLNSYNRWSSSNPIISLHAPIGLGNNNERIELDLHEKYHGPHGLIAGMTGSGKSELIITYILSMAVNYNPLEVQFILIDYKGGGLAGAFSNSSYRLPHLVGTITNLDESEINRCLVSIESELKRRQIAFNKAREISGDSTIDIYKYQKLYREGIVSEPISHLFIISDEFAELKSERPEFMSQLIQTARIGRSLGVHLILATQKPSGIVDAQIWSNTRFRICLRVQEQNDSTEVIKRNDAAFLKQTGRFYLQVGQNEIFTLAQAAWAGGKYIPSNQINKNVDSSVDFINNIGSITKTIKTIKNNDGIKASGEELSNVVKYLSDTALSLNIKPKQLWLDRIPDQIFVDDLIKKYNYQKIENILNPVIGEFDDPSHQKQHLLTLPLSKNGNVLIYGISGSGKENFISSMIYSSIVTYTPEEVNYYIIDCGAGSLKNYLSFPIVGDVVSSDNQEKIDNLFKMITSLIDQRKELLLDYNGSYELYLKSNKEKIPHIVVVINEYETLREAYEEYEDVIIELSREAYKYGIYFVLTVSTPNGIRFKLKQNFNLIFALGQNNNDDFNTILGNVNKQFPSKNKGRGIVRSDKIYEFQTASIIEEEKLLDYIKETAKKYKSIYPVEALRIPVLPNKVTYKEIAASFGKNDNLILGINKDTLGVCEYNYKKNLVNLIISQDIEDEFFLVKPVINELMCLKNDVYIFDSLDITFEDGYKKYCHYYQNNYDEYIKELKDFAEENYNKYVNNNYNSSVLTEKPKTVVILGLSNMFSKLSATGKNDFEKMMELSKDIKIINFIIFENANNIRKYEMDMWFKNSVNQNEGIWIGNGINDQYTFKISKRTNDMKDDTPLYYGFVIRRGKASYVKFIESFDIKFN